MTCSLVSRMHVVKNDNSMMQWNEHLCHAITQISISHSLKYIRSALHGSYISTKPYFNVFHNS